MLFTHRLAELFVKVWEERTGQHVWDINRGWCYQFAVLLGILYPQAIYHWDHGGHCWVEIDGKFYDSNIPCGGDDHADISFSPMPQYKTINVREVMDFWATHGGSGPVRLNMLYEIADLYMQLEMAA